MSVSRHMERMDLGKRKRKESSSSSSPSSSSSSSSEEERKDSKGSSGEVITFNRDKALEFRYQLGRLGDSMRQVNKVSMSMGWGQFIPQTPATAPRSTPKPAFTPVAGVTPMKGSEGDKVVISRKEYDHLKRKEEKRQRRREEREKEKREKEKREKEKEREKKKKEKEEKEREKKKEKEEKEREKKGDRRDYRNRDNGDWGRKNGVWMNGGGRRDHVVQKGFWGRDVVYDEMRHLGGLCGRCGENHASRECTYNKEELTCEYPPCIDKVGHTTKVCHELMKRCRLPVCEDQRGHRVKSHFRPDKVIPFGRDARAARELRRIYEDFKEHLTDAEKRIVVRYESGQDRLEMDRERRKGEEDRERRKKKAD